MAWLVGGGIVLYYIVPCRPNVVNTAERTVTRNCITFATISFLFISAVCFFYGLWFDYYFPRCQAGHSLDFFPSLWPPGLHQLFPCARLVTAWCQQSPSGRPAPSSRPGVMGPPLSPVPACFQAGVSNHASLTTSTAFLAVSATFTPLRSA